jgi:hypothetical protein
MKDIVPDPKLVAYCGLFCGACGAYLKGRCPGCTENVKATWCKVRTCCMEAGHASCADCRKFAEAMDCRKFNNLISKIFGLLFRSDRGACVRQIKAVGLAGHAEKMAAAKSQTIRR